MNMFERALGHGPDGATYQPPKVARRTVGERIRAAAWYRFGIGSRPQPRFVVDDADPRAPRS